MRLPVVKGIIKRRLLANFRADPGVVQSLLPLPFRPKLQRGYAVVGICLIRLEQVRPAGFPSALGTSSENAAHRIAVEWSETGTPREGVFIPRRDTDALLNRIAGGRIFPGEHHAADFSVIDLNGHVELSMKSRDGLVSVRVAGDDHGEFPTTSCFGSLAEASAFFEGGSLGYSTTQRGDKMDGLVLRTLDWRVRALSVTDVQSSFFDDHRRFPKGSIKFDHALVMRDLKHEWHRADDMYAVPQAAAAA